MLYQILTLGNNQIAFYTTIWNYTRFSFLGKIKQTRQWMWCIFYCCFVCLVNVYGFHLYHKGHETGNEGKRITQRCSQLFGVIFYIANKTWIFFFDTCFWTESISIASRIIDLDMIAWPYLSVMYLARRLHTPVYRNDVVNQKRSILETKYHVLCLTLGKHLIKYTQAFRFK